MKRMSILRILCVVGIISAISVCPLSLSLAAETTKDVPAAVSKSSISMPVLRGDLWQKMTNDEKVSFMWGAGHVINIEEELMLEFKKLRRDSFVTKAYQAMAVQ